MDKRLTIDAQKELIYEVRGTILRCLDELCIFSSEISVSLKCKILSLKPSNSIEKKYFEFKGNY